MGLVEQMKEHLANVRRTSMNNMDAMESAGIDVSKERTELKKKLDSEEEQLDQLAKEHETNP